MGKGIKKLASLREEPPVSLGMLIHPEYGLWHAYRAALLFDRPVDGVPKRIEQASPCATCAGKPCLSACPVSAFSGAAYDVAACAGHLARRGNERCILRGPSQVHLRTGDADRMQ